MDISLISAVRAGGEALRVSAPAPGALPAAPVPDTRPEQETAHRPAAVPAGPPSDAQAAFATSQYLVQLLAVQQTGDAADHVSRPAHITPERLSALVEFLESHVAHRPSGRSAESVDASA